MNQPRARLLTLALLASLLSFGFEGGCGEDDVIDIRGNCSDLDDQQCEASPRCELVPAPTPATADQAGAEEVDAFRAPCECAYTCDDFYENCYDDCSQCDDPPPPTNLVCVPKRNQGCEILNELQCIAHPECDPIYASRGCLMAPEDAAPEYPGDPIPCYDYDREVPAETFVGCQPREPICPPVCEIYCQYGNVLDDNGCATCACNPPPSGCERLDEYACIDRPECRPVYGDDGYDCLCAPCSEEGCPPCDCGAPDPDPTEPGGARRPPPTGFLYCEAIPTDGCDALGEYECIERPGCHPVYLTGDVPGDELCYCEPCENGDPNCENCGCTQPYPGPTFGYCEADQTGPCESLSEDQCIADPSCAPDYTVIGSCGGGRACDTPDCDPAIDPAPPCTQEVVYAGCYPAPYGECQSDADCPNGYCEQVGDACVGCETYGYCAYPYCDDGTELACRSLPPTCGPSETLAIQNGCWACLDARTCGQTNPPGECQTDADCPNGYCEHYATCTAIGCPPPPPSECVYPYCHDGSDVLCDSLPPMCPPDRTVGVVNGCWECVDPRTCQ